MSGRACSPVSGPILLSGETVSRSCTVHSIECLYLESRKFHSSAFLSSSGVKATSLFQVFRATAAIVAIAAARSVKTKCNCAFRAWRSYDVYLFRFVCDLVSPVSATCQWIYIFSFFLSKARCVRCHYISRTLLATRPLIAQSHQARLAEGHRDVRHRFPFIMLYLP